MLAQLTNLLFSVFSFPHLSQKPYGRQLLILWFCRDNIPGCLCSSLAKLAPPSSLPNPPADKPLLPLLASMFYLPSLKCLFLFLLQQLSSFPLAHLSSVCLPAHPTTPYRAQRFRTTLVWAVTVLPDFCLLKRKKNPLSSSFMTAWIPDKLKTIMCIQWWPPGYVPWLNIMNHQGEESKQAVSFFYLENIIFL